MLRSRKGVLLEQFGQLLNSDSPQKRGYSFETLLSQLLRDSGFEVHRNPKAATPRQIEIVAECDGRSFLVEAKWKKKDIGSDDIDGLRSRLERLPPDVVGCIFSISDFSKPAIDAVKENRRREILLFNATEISGLFSSRISLSALLQKKRTQLRTHAQVWFEPAARKRVNKSGAAEAIPSGCIFVQRAGNISPWVTKCTDRVEVVFSHELPYVENSSGGDCVSFRVFLDVASIPELRHALGVANRHFGLSEKGSYSIHQSPYAWHGFGVEPFLEALGSWRNRYAKAHMQSYHHSEELSYFDQLDIGMFCFNARQRVSNDPFIHSAEIQIRLPGVPVTPGPFQSFCKDLNLWCGHFESLPDSETETVYIYERLPLTMSHLVISVGDRGDRNISGAVVKNPYYKKRAPSNGKQHSAMDFLVQSELIFCAMQDWLPFGFRPGTLVLKRLEATWAGHSPILHPVCTWEDSTDERPRTNKIQIRTLPARAPS